MKNSSIADSVFKVNLKYVKLQNKTEELFFRCLDEERSVEYFKKELQKIWGKSHKYMDNAIEEYTTMIHERNIKGKEIIKEISNNSLFALIPISVIIGVENKFKRYKEREYKRSYESPAYKADKQEYISKKIKRYNNQIVPYYEKDTNRILRYVELSTYNSMIHNTNLTRSGWNQTLNDADMIGQDKFWIPYHPFSCLHCLEHQNRILTRSEILDIAGVADEAEGDILHPNCKCEIAFYFDNTAFNKPDYSEGELNEQYHIRQKVNSLTLKKERLLTDKKLQASYGEQKEVDKLNQQIKKVNSSIKELQEALPTTSLKKQVVAINR